MRAKAAELASLKQSSPPNQFRDWGKATPAGAMRWRDKIARSFVASAGGMRCRPYNYNCPLASLRQSSPPNRVSGTAAQPRPKAPGHGAMKSRVILPSVILDTSNRGSSVFAFRPSLFVFVAALIPGFDQEMRPFPWDLYATIGKGCCLFQLFI